MPKLVDAGYRVIASDQRGFGKSDAPIEVSAYEIEKIASDAVAVIQELCGEEKVYLVGHDWGSFIGWYLCLSHPEMFESFAAVSVGHPLAYRNAGPSQWLKGWYILMFQIPGLAEWIFSSNNCRALREISKTAEDAEWRVADFSRKGRLTAALNWYRANFSTLLKTEFGKCEVPTLGVYSTGDVALTEKQMVDSQKYMSAQWQYVKIQNSSHWIPLEQPEVFVNEACKWFM